MQKRDSLMLSLILLIGIFSVVGSMPILVADNDDNDSGISANASVSVSANSDNDSDDERENNSNVNDSEDEDNERDNKSDNSEDSNSEDVRVISSKTTLTRGNCTVRIEKEVRIEDGKRTEVIKRKIKCNDGVESEFQVKITNRTEDGIVREKFRYEIKGKNITVDAEDEIDLEENTAGSNYSLRARLRNGNHTNIRIMPDTASEIALERLRAKNFTIQFRERLHNNVPRVVYNIESNDDGRFLGIFKIRMRANAEVDPETGELLDVNKPWWAFMVAESAEVDANADAGGTFLANSSDADSNDTNNSAA